MDFFTNILMELLHISLLSGGMILLILLIQLLFGKRLPGKVTYALWVLLLIRLVFPLNISSSFSVENSMPEAVQVFNDDEVIVTGQDDVITYGSLNKEVYNYPTTGDKVMTGLTYVWIFGIFAVMFFPIISYVTLKRAIEEDEDAYTPELDDIIFEARRLVGVDKIPIKYSYYLDAPALIGVFNPMIVLPAFMKEADEDTLYNVLLHEMVHYQKQHLLLQWGFWIVKAVYWFNPLVWVAHEWMKLDGEFACDDEVVRLLGEEGKNNYGHILIDLSEGSEKSPYAINAAGLINRDSELKRRIARIGRGKKNSKVLTVLTYAMAIIMLPLFFTVKTPAMEEVKHFFISEDVAAQPVEEEGVIVDFTGYSFDSETGELKINIDYELNNEIFDYDLGYYDLSLNFELGFPKSYDSDVREMEFGDSIEIDVFDEYIMTEAESLKSVIENQDGKGQVRFVIEDYDGKRYGDPALYYLGGEVRVNANGLKGYDASNTDEVFVVDDFLSVEVLSLDLGKSNKVGVSYKVMNPLNKKVMLNDTIRLYDEEGNNIPLGGMGGSISDNIYTMEVNADHNMNEIHSIELEISSYTVKLGDNYYGYGDDDGPVWYFDIEEGEVE